MTLKQSFSRDWVQTLQLRILQSNPQMHRSHSKGQHSQVKKLCFCTWYMSVARQPLNFPLASTLSTMESTMNHEPSSKKQTVPGVPKPSSNNLPAWCRVGCNVEMKGTEWRSWSRRSFVVLMPGTRNCAISCHLVIQTWQHDIYIYIYIKYMHIYIRM